MLKSKGVVGALKMTEIPSGNRERGKSNHEAIRTVSVPSRCVVLVFGWSAIWEDHVCYVQ